VKNFQLSFALLFGILFYFPLQAEEKIEPVLKAKPAVLKALKNLGDNSALVLKDITIHGKEKLEKLGGLCRDIQYMKKTGPGRRNWCLKLAWMPDRKRAFFCGANHQVPHRLNDAWEYDLASNTWVVLYAPDYDDVPLWSLKGNKAKIMADFDKKTLVIKDGWLRTKKGGPAHIAHTWWGLTYDPELKAAVWYCAWPPYRLQGKLDAIGAKKEDLYKGPPMWLFYLETKKWEPMKTAKPWPKTAVFSSSLEYIPELKGSLLQYGGSSHLLDTAKKSWKNFPGGSERLGIETLRCYDTHRKLLIAHRGPDRKNLPRTWHMSLKKGEPGAWEKVLEDKNLPNGSDGYSMMYYDPVGKVALLYERIPKTIWAYDPDKKKWTKCQPKGEAPPFPGKMGQTIAYMDLARNVFVVIGPRAVWCYRYKKAKEKKGRIKKQSQSLKQNKTKVQEISSTIKKSPEESKAEKLYKKAVSLERRNKSIAKNFYKKILKDYPETKAATKAKQNLAKLN